MDNVVSFAGRLSISVASMHLLLNKDNKKIVKNRTVSAFVFSPGMINVYVKRLLELIPQLALYFFCYKGLVKKYIGWAGAFRNVVDE